MRHRLRDGKPMFSSVKLKPESFRKKPPVNPPEPHTVLLVCVSETALPSLSTTEMCVRLARVFVAALADLDQVSEDAAAATGAAVDGTGGVGPYGS